MMTTMNNRKRFFGIRSGAISLVGLGAVAFLAWIAQPPDSVGGEKASSVPEYNRDIRPILAENCFACHGQDSAARKAGLRLDQREAGLKAQAFVPGKPDESAMIQRILSHDPKELMPPPKTKKTLSPAQKELLKTWIQAGATYQPHWSLVTPKLPELPPVKNNAWIRNPIDRFVLAEMEKRGLQPAPEADRRTLARRLALDLTGLPPEPAEVEAFVKDTASDAYEKYVDHLMQSPHWGEHRARYWLDAARFADTHGIHFDNFREIWSYRDWVINAFNQNQPFDQFTIEQLAGDLFPNPTLEQRIATGFNRCNITTNEGGAIDEEYLVLYARDRTETTSLVWMGLTAGCAVCHDHKFDPLSTKEFYSLSAFFNNTTQNAMDGNISNTPPVIQVPRKEDRERYARIPEEIKKVREEIESHKKVVRVEFDRWLAEVKPEEKKTTPISQEGLILHAPFNEGKGTTLTFTVKDKPVTLSSSSPIEWVKGKTASLAYSLPQNGALELADVGDFEKEDRFSVSTWIRLPKPGSMGAIVARMNQQEAYRGWDFWVQDNRIGMHIINRYPEDALKVVSKKQLVPNEWHHVTASYDGSGKPSGIVLTIDGIPQPYDVETDSLKSTIKTKVPLKIGQRHTSERLAGVNLQDLRIYGRTLSAAEVANMAQSNRIQDLLRLPARDRKPEEVNDLFAWYLLNKVPKNQEFTARITSLEKELADIRSRGTVAHVMHEKQGEPVAFILERGEYDKRRDQVKVNTPSVLPPFAKDLPKNRLGLARWLLSSEHPLTTRVTVNRFWQEIFGAGIVRTTGDFGVTGELPSHPELLDWLAIEFRTRGWDIKQFFKLMVTSATYRQSAVCTAEKREIDPSNRYLSRGVRYRLDAEMIRDYALAASGLLARKIGGPSVKPYQPEGVWEAVAMIGSNTRDYRQDNGENLYRRSMYTFWKRSAPPASMDILNAPNRETCTVRRDRTNTPLQALVTLNDVQFIEACRNLAQKALEAEKTDDSRIDFVTGRLLARPLETQERQVVRQSLAQLLASYKGKAADAAKLIGVGESRPDPKLDPIQLAAWTMLVNELMNLDETLNK